MHDTSLGSTAHEKSLMVQRIVESYQIPLTERVSMTPPMLKF